MTILPKDIEEIITNINRDPYLLPRTDTPIGKYDQALLALLPDCILRNITEFDYGRSYRYSIFLTGDKEAATFEKNRFETAVKRQGTLDLISLAISAVAPYIDVQFERYLSEGMGIKQLRSPSPFGPEQEKILHLLLQYFQGQKQKRIDLQVALLTLPGIRTELKDEGDATVAAFLFYG